jgi:hypothetical protein
MVEILEAEMNRPCIGCHIPNCEYCDHVEECFGGEQDPDCSYCPRREACIQEHINIGINKADDQARDKELFR